MNTEQIKSLIRWLVTVFGATIAGWFAHSGYITADQVIGVLNSPSFLSIAVSVVSGIAGLLVHTQTNAVTVVDTIAKDPNSPVAGVITKPTLAGKEMADSIPGNTTAAAGTVAAASMAAK